MTTINNVDKNTLTIVVRLVLERGFFCPIVLNQLLLRKDTSPRRYAVVSEALAFASVTKSTWNDEQIVGHLSAEGGAGHYVEALCALPKEDDALKRVRAALQNTFVGAAAFVPIKCLAAAIERGHARVLCALFSHHKTRALFFSPPRFCWPEQRLSRCTRSLHAYQFFRARSWFMHFAIVSNRTNESAALAVVNALLTVPLFAAPETFEGISKQIVRATLNAGFVEVLRVLLRHIENISPQRRLYRVHSTLTTAIVRGMLCRGIGMDEIEQPPRRVCDFIDLYFSLSDTWLSFLWSDNRIFLNVQAVIRFALPDYRTHFFRACALAKWGNAYLLDAQTYFQHQHNLAIQKRDRFFAECEKRQAVATSSEIREIQAAEEANEAKEVKKTEDAEEEKTRLQNDFEVNLWETMCSFLAGLEFVTTSSVSISESAHAHGTMRKRMFEIDLAAVHPMEISNFRDLT